MIEGFAHLNLRAPQPLLERLRDFYCEVVGLRMGPRPAFPSAGYWLYVGAQDVLHLTACGAEEAAGRQGRSSYDHVAFHASDLAAVEARLKQLALPYEKTSVPGGGAVQLFLQDPAGLGVELNFRVGAPTTSHRHS